MTVSTTLLCHKRRVRRQSFRLHLRLRVHAWRVLCAPLTVSCLDITGLGIHYWKRTGSAYVLGKGQECLPEVCSPALLGDSLLLARNETSLVSHESREYWIRQQTCPALRLPLQLSSESSRRD